MATQSKNEEPPRASGAQTASAVQAVSGAVTGQPATANVAPAIPSGELGRRLVQLERENRRIRELAERADLQVAHLEKRVRSVESTMSFRLGHALIQATKSLDGARELPAMLLELSRESRRRKRGKSELTLADAVLRSPQQVVRELWAGLSGKRRASRSGSVKRDDSVD